MKEILSKSPSTHYSWVIIGFIGLVLTAILVWAIPDFYNRWRLALLLSAILLLGYHYRAVLNETLRAVFVVFILAIIIVYSSHYVQMMASNVANPPQWDFQALWLYGRVADQRLNFYEPKYFAEASQSMNLSKNFREQVIEVGFIYPPPSMFLYMPLGWYKMSTAHKLWYVLQMIILVATTGLLYKLFFKEGGVIGLMFITALVLMLEGTASTIAFGQTTFIALCLLLLFWKNREHPLSGIALGLSILIKPFFAFLFIYLLARRKWHVLTSTIMALAGLSLLSLLAFGPDTFFSFFTANPNSERPDYTLTQPYNQSLLSMVLRHPPNNVSSASPLLHPMFIALALISTGITIWLVYRLENHDEDWFLMLPLSLSVLLFPVSWGHYSLLLIVPIIIFFAKRPSFTPKVWGTIIFIAVLYALSKEGYDGTFIANAIVWSTLAAVAYSTLIRQPDQLDDISPGTSVRLWLPVTRIREFVLELFRH